MGQKIIELKIYVKSLIIIMGFAISMFGIGELLSKPIVMIFVGYDHGLMHMTQYAL